MAELPALPDRIDLAIATPGVVVTRFWLIGGRNVAPHGADVKPVGFDFEGALVWCEANGYTVRRWDGGARAWRGKPWPIRTRAQILRRRSEVERMVMAGHGSSRLLGLDLAYDM